MRKFSPDSRADRDPGVVAIQVSRLNEAMLMAFSAMSPANLKAVDQVVQIVRELDRYGGAFATERRRPEASRLDAPADEDAAFASAWLDGSEPALPDFEADSPGFNSDDRSENLAQHLEKIEFTPGFAAPSAAAARSRAPRDATHCTASEREGGDVPSAASTGGGGPQIPLQGLEKIESAPGFAPAAGDPAGAFAVSSRLRDTALRCGVRHEARQRPPAAAASDERPEIPQQPSEVARNCQAGVSPKCHIPRTIDFGEAILRDRDAEF